MTQRVKRSERKKRQREGQYALWIWAQQEINRLAKLPPLRAEDYIFRAAGRVQGDPPKESE